MKIESLGTITVHCEVDVAELRHWPEHRIERFLKACGEIATVEAECKADDARRTKKALKQHAAECADALLTE